MMDNNVYYIKSVHRFLMGSVAVFVAILCIVGSVNILGTDSWRNILILYLPAFTICIYGLIIAIFHRIELKSEEIVKRSLIVKRIRWEEITKIELTELTQCIISGNKTKIEITSDISNIDKIIRTVLSRARCNPDVKIVGPQDLMDKYRNID